MPTKKTHYEFTVNGKKYKFPNIETLPSGFTYYSQKASNAAEANDARKALEYSNKVYEFIFGEDSPELEAVMHFTPIEQQGHIQKWMQFEQSRLNVNPSKS